MTVMELVKMRENNFRQLRSIMESIKNAICIGDFRSADTEVEELQSLISEGRRISDALSVRSINVNIDD